MHALYANDGLSQRREFQKKKEYARNQNVGVAIADPFGSTCHWAPQENFGQAGS